MNERQIWIAAEDYVLGQAKSCFMILQLTSFCCLLLGNLEFLNSAGKVIRILIRVLLLTLFYCQ